MNISMKLVQLLKLANKLGIEYLVEINIDPSFLYKEFDNLFDEYDLDCEFFESFGLQNPVTIDDIIEDYFEIGYLITILTGFKPEGFDNE